MRKKIQLNIFISYSIILILSSIAFQSCTKHKKDFMEEVVKSNDMAIEWLLNNIRPKGIFVYLYNVREDSSSNKNNMVRQLMASRLLAELSQTNSAFLEKHKKNLNYIFKYWYQKQGQIGYVFYNEKSKLGANAMLLRTLVFSPSFDQFRDKARMLYNGIVHLLYKDGAFKPFLIEPSYKYDRDYVLTFYSGEAILALVEYYKKIGNEKILKAAVRAQDFYIERYVKNLKDNYYPAYVPWHTQSLNKLYKLTKNDKYANAVFILNDELLKIQDNDEFPGRFHDPQFPQYGNPHASSDGVFTEGLAYAYEIAVLKNDQKHIKKYERAIKLAVRNLISLQYSGDNRKSKGAFRCRAGDNRIRVDTTQHTIDAYRKIIEVFKINKKNSDY